MDTQAEEETTIRAWHNITVQTAPADDMELNAEAGNGDGDKAAQEPITSKAYVGVLRVLSHEDDRKQVIDNAYRELKGWQRRYHAYSEFSPVFTSIEQLGFNLPA